MVSTEQPPIVIRFRKGQAVEPAGAYWLSRSGRMEACDMRKLILMGAVLASVSLAGCVYRPYPYGDRYYGGGYYGDRYYNGTYRGDRYDRDYRYRDYRYDRR